MTRRQVRALLRHLGFPPGLWSTDGSGLVANYDRRGRLVEMFWAEDGVPMGRRLILDPGRADGRLTIPEGSGGTADFEVYKNGCVETFDAWSDASGPRRRRWRTWVREQVGRLRTVQRARSAGDACGMPPVAVARTSGLPVRSLLALDPDRGPTGRQWPWAIALGLCATAFDDPDLLRGRRERLVPGVDGFERTGWRRVERRPALALAATGQSTKAMMPAPVQAVAPSAVGSGAPA